MKKIPEKVLQTVGAVLLVLLIGAAYAQVGFQPVEEAMQAIQPSEMDASGAEEEAVPSGYLVVVDAGHGGRDGGAVGKNGVVEAGINLAVALYLKEALEAAGVDVLLTRTDENALAATKKTDMLARKQIMNTPGVDVVVSIHMNSFKDRSVNGPMAFYMKGSEQGKLLAQHVIAKVCESIAYPLRSASTGDFFMVRESPSPSVLVECGFLSNAKDEAALNEAAYQQTLASAIARGVLDYLSAREDATQSSLAASDKI